MKKRNWDVSCTCTNSTQGMQTLHTANTYEKRKEGDQGVGGGREGNGDEKKN